MTVSIPRRASRTSRESSSLPCINSGFLSSRDAKASTFLSRTLTLCPFCSRAAVRSRPTDPAPPVIRTFIAIAPADFSGLLAEQFRLQRADNRPEEDDNRRCHERQCERQREEYERAAVPDDQGLSHRRF